MARSLSRTAGVGPSKSLPRPHLLDLPVFFYPYTRDIFLGITFQRHLDQTVLGNKNGCVLKTCFFSSDVNRPYLYFYQVHKRTQLRFCRLPMKKPRTHTYTTYTS